MRKLFLLAGALALFAIPSTSHAQGIQFGPQVSYGADSDLGAGARAVFGLGQLYENLEGIVSGDYFFYDCDPLDCSWIELNANAALPIGGTPSLAPYVGAGLNFARVSVDAGEFGGGEADASEVGLNLLGGLKFPMSSITPFAEARIELGGGEQFVLTGGILFGGN